MASAIILARTLPTESFAAYSYFQLTVSMLAAYTAMGMGVSASKFFAEFGGEKPGSESSPIGLLWSISIILSAVGSILILFIPGGWFNAALTVPSWLLAAGVFALGITVVPSGAVIGLELYKQASYISASSGASMLLIAWWASERGSPTIAMSAIVFSSIVQALGESLLVIRSIGWKKISSNFLWRSESLASIASFAGPMVIVTLVASSGSWLLGSMILSSEGGNAAFALYVIGLQWFSLGLLLPGMFARVILPRLVRTAISDHSSKRGKKIILYGLIASTAASTVMALCALLLGSWLILIYGSNFHADRWFLAAFLGAAIFSAPANTLGNALYANNKQRTWLALMIIWLGVLLLVGSATLSLGAVSGAIAHAVAAAVLSLLAAATLRAMRFL